jgi:hypothetical protein
MYENDAQRLHLKSFFDLTSEQEMEDVREVSKERYLGYHFVRNSGPQHNRYRQDLSNQFAQGKNSCPMTLQEAYDLLQKYEKNPTAQAISGGTVLPNTKANATKTRIRVKRLRRL